MSAPTPVGFTFEGSDVRQVVIDGKRWFLARDIGECIGLKSSGTQRAVSLLDDCDRNAINGGIGQGGRPPLYVSHRGALIMALNSRKPIARRLAKLITSEVLPAIATSGSYTAAPRTREERLADGMAAAQEVIAEQAKVIEAMQPAADIGDRVLAGESSHGIQEACKWLGLNRPKTVDWLIREKFFYRGPREDLTGHASMVDQGLVVNIPTPVPRGRGSEILVNWAKITPKGMGWIEQRVPADCRKEE